MACPTCGVVIPTSASFCPNCGTKLKEPGVSTSIGKQALIYIVSFFLAPLGLGYAFKYLRQKDPKAKQIGMISVALTVAGIAAAIWISKAVMDSFYGSLNSLLL